MENIQLRTHPLSYHYQAKPALSDGHDGIKEQIRPDKHLIWPSRLIVAAPFLKKKKKTNLRN